MLTETELIVLKSVRYSDNHSIVHTYSQSFGSLSLKVSHSARRKRGGMRAFFIPLSLIKTTLDYQEKREILIPREATLVHAPFRPTIDARANAIALFTTEVLGRVLRTEQSEPTLYNFLRKEILRLEEIPSDLLPSYHLTLLTGVTHHLGILPRTEEYREGYSLHFESGTFAYPITYAERANVASSALLYHFITESEPEKLPLNRIQRNDLLDLLLSYLSYYYPNLNNLKSPSILRTLFSD